MKRYTLRVEIDLDPRDAIDDVAARETAMTQFAEMHLGRRATPTVRVKLQEIHEGKPPRPVAFNPFRE